MGEGPVQLDPVELEPWNRYCKTRKPPAVLELELVVLKLIPQVEKLALLAERLRKDLETS